MRTRNMKAIAEHDEEDYAEYANACISEGQEPMDIWAWIAMEQATAEEAYNDYLKDEGLLNDKQTTKTI